MTSAKLTLELDIEVFFDFLPEEKPTRHCPGSDAQVEISSIELNGIEAGVELFKTLMNRYRGELLEACQDEIEGKGE